MIDTNKKKGHSSSRFYRTWRSILVRCNSPKYIEAHRYLKRGIKCEWNSFEEFYLDMNESYLKHVNLYGEKNTSIDRINNDGNYSKKNCKWSTSVEQNNNRSSNHLLDFEGKKQSIADWSRETGIPYNWIKLRIRRGWSVRKALTTKERKVNQFD